MADDLEDESAERQRRRRLIGGLAVAILFTMVCLWIWLPRWDFLVEPVAPDVRDEIAEAVEAATDPSERARLRLELAALEHEDAARRSGLRGTIAQVGTALLAGGAAVWGALAAWGQLQDNRKEAEAARADTAEQLRLSREELRLSQERTAEELRLSREALVLSRDAQLVDRFTRAVDQLGNDNLDVQLGGIYALERIANDSTGDLPTVVAVLAAFVRHHSPRPKSTEREGPKVPPAGSPADHASESGDLSRRAPHVQAALTVLGRMKWESGAITVDLAATDLERADLGNAELWGVNLGEAGLRGARLRDSDLGFAYLEGADLRDADLVRADLRVANLKRADLRGAELWDAELGGAALCDARLGGADLRVAKLASADLGDAKLVDTKLGAADLAHAVADAETKWPEGFDPDAAGVIFIDRAAGRT